MSDPEVRPVASRRIADAIAARILSGELEPGARIKQHELARELGTSRIPVREALRILERSGLVTQRANSGAWVAEMSERELKLAYEIRERIEPLLLLDSMPRLTIRDVERMTALQEQIEANVDDVEEFLRLDREFHWVSYSRHEAAHLAEIIERLWDTTQAHRRMIARLTWSHRPWFMNAEHQLLLEAMRAGDTETAASVLGFHIRRSRVAPQDRPRLLADHAPYPYSATSAGDDARP